MKKRKRRMAIGLRVYSLLGLTFFMQATFAQGPKPTLNWDVIDSTNWDRYHILEPRVSDDGKYVCYGVDGQKVLQSTTTGFKQLFPSWSSLYFVPGAEDVAEHLNDTLRIFHPESTRPFREYIHVGDVGVDNASPFVRVSGKDLLLLRMGTELVLLDCKSGKEQRYPGVTRYSFQPDGHTLLYAEAAGKGQRLHRLDLGTLKNTVEASTDGQFGNMIIDLSGKQIAAVVTGADAAQIKILLCRTADHSCRTFDQSVLPKGDRCTIEGGSLRFVCNGALLIFSRKLEIGPVALPDTGGVALNIWRYQDKQLPHVGNPGVFEDDFPMTNRTDFMMGLETHTGTVRPLEEIDTTLGYFDHMMSFGPETCSYAVVSHTVQVSHMIFRPRTFDLLNLQTGEKTAIEMGDETGDPFFSPDGRHLLIFGQSGIYYSYDMPTGKKIRLNDPSLLPLVNKASERPGTEGFGLPAWADGGVSALINSEYDIWKLDMEGVKAPVCITREEGKRTGVMFRLVVSGERDLLLNAEPKAVGTDRLILLGQDTRTKDQGIYSYKMDGSVVPGKLCAGPYFLYANFDALGHNIGHETPQCVVKAAHAPVYAFIGSTVRDGSNLFVLRGSQPVQAITDNHPYKDYNWMSSELVSWTTADGQPDQGILYKPEDFDVNKQYPVIVCYYEKESSQLNAEFQPEKYMWRAFMHSIPYYVSHGYLVFFPDIHYTLADLRGSVANCVIPGVEELMKRPYVDAHHIGATGQSFGGFETMWLVTKSKKLFAAAFAENGGSDMFYVSYMLPDFPVHGQLRMGVRPYERPDLYVKNSSVFFAPEVETPLCLCNNDEDSRCPLPGGIGMFEYLRDLGKPVWMLQYRHQSHGMGKFFDKTDADVVDYRVRFQQFFDHYLKGAPEPRWMKGGNNLW